MKYEIYVLLEIDPDATFFGVDKDSMREDLVDQVHSALYDIDDVRILDLELKGPTDDYE